MLTVSKRTATLAMSAEGHVTRRASRDAAGRSTRPSCAAHRLRVYVGQGPPSLRARGQGLGGQGHVTKGAPLLGTHGR